MKRLTLYLLIALALLSVAVCLREPGIQDDSSQVVAAATSPQWPQFGYDIANAAQSPYTGPQTNTLKWDFQLNGWGNSAVIDANGTAYVGTNRGTLYAINTDGSEKWSFQLSAIDDVTGLDDQAYGTISGLALGSDGTIYLGRSLGQTQETQNTQNQRHLYAFNPGGSQEWNLSVGTGDITTNIKVASDGTIYFGTLKGFNGGNTTLYAVNPDGTEKWSTLLSQSARISSPAIASNGTIYVGSEKFVALTPQDGSVEWEYNIQTPTGTTFAPAVASDGTIYAAVAQWADNDSNKIFALNPDGTKKWELSVGTIETSPAIASDGTIYVTSWVAADSDPAVNTGLTAISPQGSVTWSYGLNTTYPDYPSIYVGCDSSPIIGADGIIYFGSDADNIYAVNPDGTTKWIFTEGECGVDTCLSEFDNSPAIDAEGTLYICHAGGPGANDTHRCYAIGDGGGTTTTTTSTTTISDECEITGDFYPCDGEVSLAEVVDIVSNWLSGLAELEEVIEAINNWVGG